MGQLFTGIYGIFRKHPWAFILFLVLLLGFEAWFGSQIVFEEDINKVIPATEKNKRLITVLEHSKFADRLVICISLSTEQQRPEPDLLVSYAEALIDSLESPVTSQYIETIEGKVSPGSFGDIYDLFYENLPLFLDEDDYESIDNMLGDSAIAMAIKKDYEALISPGGFVMKDFILKDPLSLTPIALKKLESLKVSENFSLYQDYIISVDQKNLLFFVIPANPSTETSKNAELLTLIDRYSHNLDNYFNKKASLRYFGSMPVSIGNAQQIKRDIIVTLSIAVFLLIVFLGLYFRRKLTFLLLFIPALLGGGFAIAALYLIKSEVSAISLGLGSVMLGISVDYALHFLSHLQYSGSVRTVIKDISAPIMTSSITTASAFLCLLVLKSEALRDLGLFAALSVFSSAIFTLTILPLLFKEEQKAKVHNNPVANLIRRVAAFEYHRKGKLVWLIVLLFIVFLFTSGKVKFESNMDSMNYMAEELIESEDYLDSISSYKLKSVYLVSIAGEIEDALLANERLIPSVDSLKKKDIIRSYTSVHPFYPSSERRTEKLGMWKNFWTEEKVRNVEQSIINSSAEFRFRDNTFNGFFELLETDNTPGLSALYPLREEFLDEYITEKDSLSMVTTVLKVAENDKAVVYDVFEGKKDIIVFDRQSLTSSFMDGLRDDFDTLIMISLIVVFLILTVSFGRIELGIITFIPLLISWVFTLGIMGLLGIRFNIFNIIISTFIFGLGIDYAIFCMRGLMQEYQYGRKKLISYKISILLSGITTLVGIGVLIFAKHPALQSIAISAIIGILSVIFITYTLLPRLFNFLIRHEGRNRRWPATFKDFLFSINTFLIFIVGVTILNIAGLALKYLAPIKTTQKKLIFHQMLSLACRVIVYGSVNCPKYIRSPGKKIFKEPAVIICNHQSHLDTVVNIMQNPRMILLTHPWVQKSMFFGWFVRFADFLPVHKGLDPIMDQMREIVNKGYSIFVFPEGTRSYDLNIKRFHQGAFYIARELNLDIIPVISYGTGNAMPKFEPFMKTTTVSMTVLPRISSDSPLIKDTLLATSKSVRHHMQKEYATIRKEFETPVFFRKKVIRNYLYRGPVLEWYMKVKIRMEKQYLLFHKKLPEQGLITDIGCGYGFMSYMLQLMAPNRQFLCYDYDPDKVDTANHCALKNKNIRFIHADVTGINPEQSDAFILADVLHYMPAEEQEKLIAKCAERLKDNGVIVIRDADISLRKKHLGTRISEFVSTRVGFNITQDKQHKLYFNSKENYLDIFSRLKLDVSIIDDTKLTSNLVYILKKQ